MDDAQKEPPAIAAPNSLQRTVARELIRAGAICGVVAWGGLGALPIWAWLCAVFLEPLCFLAGYVLWYCE
jgi:hypothetical protein